MHIAGIVVALMFSAGEAGAQPLAVAPDACPVSADAPVYAGDDIEAEDLNPWRDAAADFAPTVDRTIADHSQADRIFLRLRADPQTGETLTQPDASCKD